MGWLKDRAEARKSVEWTEGYAAKHEDLARGFAREAKKHRDSLKSGKSQDPAADRYLLREAESAQRRSEGAARKARESARQTRKSLWL